MPVVFLIAAVAVLGGVFLAATGRGGEMAVEHPDHAPLDLGPVSAPDIALLRPPTALWGYNIQVTDEALDLIARAMRDRDVTIAQLQQELATRDVRDPGAGHVDVGNLYYRDPDATRPDVIRFDATRPATTGPATTGPDGTGPDGTGPDGTGPDGTGPDGTGPDVIRPDDTRPEFSQAPQALQPPLASGAPLAFQTPEIREAPRPRKAPGVLVAPLPHRAPPPADVTQPANVTQPADAIPTAEAAYPADTRPASYDARVQGPQGSYDTHGWWAQQEEAAREEAQRQAQAGAEGRLGESGSAGESGSPEPAGYPAGVPADRDDSGPGRAATQPNPAIASSPDTPGTPGTPDDDPLAVEEEQGW